MIELILIMKERHCVALSKDLMRSKPSTDRGGGKNFGNMLILFYLYQQMFFKQIIFLLELVT